MKIPTIIFLVFFTSLSVFSQTSTPEFNHKKYNLIKGKSDLVVEYYLSLGGMFVPEFDEGCSEFEPRYLFWISNNQYYKQKFTECKIYPQVQVKKSGLILTILNNLKKIKKAELKPVQSENIVQIEVVHDDFWYFKIHTQNDSFEKSISRFELETEFINNNERNINYESNQKSIIKKLIIMAEKELY